MLGHRILDMSPGVRFIDLLGILWCYLNGGSNIHTQHLDVKDPIRVLELSKWYRSRLLFQLMMLHGRTSNLTALFFLWFLQYRWRAARPAPSCRSCVNSLVIRGSTLQVKKGWFCSSYIQRYAGNDGPFTHAWSNPVGPV